MAQPRLSIAKQVKKQATRLLETGQRFTRFDQIRQRHFWSSYYFNPDANGYINQGNFPIFVTPPGSNGQGFPSGYSLSERESNWKSQNRVPDNQNFEITELGVSIGMVIGDMIEPGEGEVLAPFLAAVPPKTVNQFLNNTILAITYLTNSVPLGFIGDFAQSSAPQAGSAFISNNLTLSNANNFGYFRSNGFPAPALRRRFKIPILLQHGETFSFAFDVPRSFYIGHSFGGGLSTETNISPVVLRMDFWATESFVEKS